MNQIPNGDQLRHVNQITENTRTHPTRSMSTTRTKTTTTIPSMYIGGGVPPIPVRRIQDGHFIGVAVLLKDNLEAANATDEDQSKDNGRKLHLVTHIMDWIQRFSTYIAEVSCTKSERVVDLVAYFEPNHKWPMEFPGPGLGSIRSSIQAKGFKYSNCTVGCHGRHPVESVTFRC